MSVKSILKSELVFAKQKITSKKRLLENIALIASKRLHCDKDAVYDALLGREKLGSTGIGQGVAIPHCRLEEANKTTIVLLSLEKSIDFDSIDRQPVDLIFSLIVPPRECDSHLTTLSEIAELAQDEEKLNTLRNAESDQELYAAFSTLIKD